MKRKTIKRLFSSCLAAMTLAVVSCAPGEYAYDSWNYDDNDYLDAEEFNTALTDMGYFEDWDADDDSILTEDEWNTGLEDFLNDSDIEDYGLFSDWDINDDGVLDDEEFNESIYTAIDANKNDLIEENEYDMWYDDDFGV